MGDELTSRQNQILDYIKNWVRDKGYPPSVREIGRGVGLNSTSTVHGHLYKMEKKGYIRRDPTKPRTIEIQGFNCRVGFKDIPVLRTVTRDIFHAREIEDVFPVPADIVGDGDAFFVRVAGDRISEPGILRGDLVLVRPMETAHEGEIVLAVPSAVAGDPRNGTPEAAMETEIIQFSAEAHKNRRVIGKVVGLIRKYT